MGDLPAILDLLDLEYIEQNLYRSCVTFSTPLFRGAEGEASPLGQAAASHQLFGGQVAAQALYAAGRTVAAGRLPHSLHGYFLRAGSTQLPTLFRVERDRDGGSFSARRVVAIQNGEVIFNMAASFAAPRPAESAADRDATPAGSFPPVADLPGRRHPRHASFEFRHDATPYRMPARFWIKCLDELPPPDDDPLLHAAVLTYISDISTGLVAMETPGYAAASSIDHAVWFHRPARMDEWVWQDLHPQTISAGRGWYTGAFYAPDATRVASVAQEALFRKVHDS